MLSLDDHHSRLYMCMSLSKMCYGTMFFPCDCRYVVLFLMLIFSRISLSLWPLGSVPPLDWTSNLTGNNVIIFLLTLMVGKSRTKQCNHRKRPAVSTKVKEYLPTSFTASNLTQFYLEYNTISLGIPNVNTP